MFVLLLSIQKLKIPPEPELIYQPMRITIKESEMYFLRKGHTHPAILVTLKLTKLP